MFVYTSEMILTASYIFTCSLYLYSLFQDEPVEFVRKVHDPLGDWLSPLIAATNLLQVPKQVFSLYVCFVRVLCVYGVLR